MGIYVVTGAEQDPGDSSVCAPNKNLLRCRHLSDGDDGDDVAVDRADGVRAAAAPRRTQHEARAALDPRHRHHRHLQVSSSAPGQFPISKSVPRLQVSSTSPGQFPISRSVPHLQVSSPSPGQFPISRSVPHLQVSSSAPGQFPISRSIPQLQVSSTSPGQFHISRSVPHLQVSSSSPGQFHISRSVPHLQVSSPSPRQFLSSRSVPHLQVSFSAPGQFPNLQFPVPTSALCMEDSSLTSGHFEIVTGLSGFPLHETFDTTTNHRSVFLTSSTSWGVRVCFVLTPQNLFLCGFPQDHLHAFVQHQVLPVRQEGA